MGTSQYCRSPPRRKGRKEKQALLIEKNLALFAMKHLIVGSFRESLIVNREARNTRDKI